MNSSLRESPIFDLTHHKEKCVNREFNPQTLKVFTVLLIWEIYRLAMSWLQLRIKIKKYKTLHNYTKLSKSWCYPHEDKVPCELMFLPSSVNKVLQKYHMCTSLRSVTIIRHTFLRKSSSHYARLHSKHIWIIWNSCVYYIHSMYYILSRPRSPVVLHEHSRRSFIFRSSEGTSLSTSHISISPVRVPEYNPMVVFNHPYVNYCKNPAVFVQSYIVHDCLARRRAYRSS